MQVYLIIKKINLVALYLPAVKNGVNDLKGESQFRQIDKDDPNPQELYKGGDTSPFIGPSISIPYCELNLRWRNWELANMF